MRVKSCAGIRSGVNNEPYNVTDKKEEGREIRHPERAHLTLILIISSAEQLYSWWRALIQLETDGRDAKRQSATIVDGATRLLLREESKLIMEDADAVVVQVGNVVFSAPRPLALRTKTTAREGRFKFFFFPQKLF